MRPPPQARSTSRAAGCGDGGMCSAREAASQCRAANPPAGRHHWSARSSYWAGSLRGRRVTLRSTGLLQGVVPPVHQGVAPLRRPDVLLARALGEVALHVAVHRAHVVEVVVCEVGLPGAQELDDSASRGVAGGFPRAVALLADGSRIIALQPLLQLARCHVHRLGELAADGVGVGLGHGRSRVSAPPSGYLRDVGGKPQVLGRFDAKAAALTARARGESVHQVLDRNLGELLQELRVAFTGVQVLFAFLLGLAFTQRFATLDGFDLTVYTVALMSTALATIVLIAPVSFHRIVFRRRQKAALVVVADRCLITGLAALVLAITSAVLLILDVVLGHWQGLVGGGLVALAGVLTWYVLPVWVRRAGGEAAPENGAEACAEG